MHSTLAVLPVILATAVSPARFSRPPAGPVDVPAAAWPRVSRLALLHEAAPPAGARFRLERGGSGLGPGCDLAVAEGCPPRLEIPGMQASGIRTSRGDLVLALLERSRFAPVASVAAWLAGWKLRVQYMPARRGIDPGGWGEVIVSLRWKLDANGPAPEPDADAER